MHSKGEYNNVNYRLLTHTTSEPLSNSVHMNTTRHALLLRNFGYHTIQYDKLYFLAPKSWRIANLICRTEPNRTERVMRKTKNKYNGLPMTMGGHKEYDWTLMMCERILLRSFLWATVCKTVRHICYRTVVCLSLLWPPCVADADVIFCSCGDSFFFFFPRLFSSVGNWMSAILPHMMWPQCEFRRQVWNVLHAARWNTGRKGDAKIGFY